nr:MAG TPA: hypothetical protein [Caudoviricetes sp.]
MKPKFTTSDANCFIDSVLLYGIGKGSIKKPLKVAKRYVKAIKYLKRITKSNKL